MSGKKVSALCTLDSKNDIHPLPSSDDDDSNTDEQNDGPDLNTLLNLDAKSDGQNLKIDTFILVEYTNPKKRSSVYYVGRILECEPDKRSVRVNFLKQATQKHTWVYPNIPDVAWINFDKIKKILPSPVPSGTTKRQSSRLQFDSNIKHLLQMCIP
jgi:hypothetical protein